MATTFQATKVSSSTEQMPGIGDGQSLKCASSTYTITAALVANDVIQGPLIQAGSVIVDVMVVVSDLDTGGSPALTLDVGYGTDPDYFAVAATTGQTGGVIRASAATALPLVLATNDTIDAKVATGPATGATSGTVTITVFFLPRNA
jgi:hypothetical protein